MGKLILAALICAVLMLGIWIATIWNNFAFHNGLIADDYLMPVSTFALLIIVLIINPVLKRHFPRLSFSRRGLCVICGVLFMAAMPPSAGILRQLVFPLGDSVHRANNDPAVAGAYEKLAPRPALYPDTLEYEAEIPVIEPFVDELDDGEKIPWKAWIKPISAWSGIVLPWFAMMVALAAILTSYWQNKERVQFPLLTIFRPIIDVPEVGPRRTPLIFRDKIFWAGCAVVFLLHAMAQAKQYFPTRIPAIPLGWQLWKYYSEDPWRYLPWFFKRGQLFFTFMAVAFFLPNRTSLSIWLVQVITAFYIMTGRAYFPPFEGHVIGDARTGAAMAFSLVVVWLARHHLLHVARCMVRPVSSPGDRAYRIAGWAFVLSCVAMFSWFLWVRVPAGYAAVFVIAAVLSALVLMRVVAETGLPLFFMSTPTFINFLKMIPVGLRSLSASYFGGIFSVWLGSGQRLCVGAAAIQAMALDKDDDAPRHVRKAGLFMLVLGVSLVCAWLLILFMAYNNSETPDGRPIAWWGRQQFKPAENLLVDTVTGVRGLPFLEHLPGLIVGASLVVLLYGLCHTVPWWPVHPVGLVGTGTWCVSQIWPNVFFGWLIKNALLKYGGSRAYTAAKPFFIGAVIGELFALFLWTGIALALAANGLEYRSVTILPY